MDTREQEHAPPRRRRFSIECKRRIVEESLHGTDSVSVVARRHDVNANQLFRWRRLYRLGELVEPSEGSALTLLPVRLAASESPPTQPGVKSVLPPSSLEIQLAGGHRLVVRGAADAAALRVALEVLGR